MVRTIIGFGSRKMVVLDQMLVFIFVPRAASILAVHYYSISRKTFLGIG